MNKKIDKTDVEQLDYWTAQVNVVTTFAEIGIPLELSKRLDPFRLVHSLDTVAGEGKYPGGLIALAMQALSMLVKARKAGLEPEHKDGTYA